MCMKQCYLIHVLDFEMIERNAHNDIVSLTSVTQPAAAKLHIKSAER